MLAQARSVHLLRGRAARRRQRRRSRRSRSSVRQPRGWWRRLLDDVPAVRWRRWPSTATCEPHRRASRRSSRASPTRASPASTCTSSAAQAACVEDRAGGRRRASSSTRRRAEALRIEAGVPMFHRDMDEETIPLEAGIESRAISLTKGCYVGQEVIIRVLHRGHGRVARKLVGLDARRRRGAAGRGRRGSSGDREVGAMTSSARVAGARAADCARLRAPRLRRAGHRCRRWRRDGDRAAVRARQLPFVPIA